MEQTITESGGKAGVISRVGIGDQSLRIWVRQAQIDSGRRTA